MESSSVVISEQLKCVKEAEDFVHERHRWNTNEVSYLKKKCPFNFLEIAYIFFSSEFYPYPPGNCFIIDSLKQAPSLADQRCSNQVCCLKNQNIKK